MYFHRFVSIAVAAAAAVAVPNIGHATPNPSWSLNFNGATHVVDSTDTTKSLDGATGTVGFSPSASLTATSSATESIDASMFYTFTLSSIVGGNVPLDIDWAASYGTAPSGNATVQITFKGNNIVDVIGGQGSFSQHGTYHATVSSNGSNSFLLQASVGGGAGTAAVDPYVYIDPQFLSDNGYDSSDFTFSFPGLIQNQPLLAAVPEPSSLVLIVSSLAGIGLLCRHRRRRKFQGGPSRAMA